MNLVKEHVSRPTRSCHNKVLVEWIRQGKVEWVQDALLHRFGTLENPTKRPHNSDKLLTAFVIYFEDEEHRKAYPLQRLLHLLHLLIQYYLSFPVYWSNQNTISLSEKKKIVLNLVFISGYIPFIEYAIQFLIVHEQELSKEEHRKPNYFFLEWSSYSRDKEMYRQAHVYSISSTYKHSCMSYMLLHYVGDDPDLLAMRKQIYKEQLYVSERRMSVFTLE